MSETAVETQPKQGANALPGLTRKLAQIARKVEEAAQQEEGNLHRDDERLRNIIHAASGGGVERILRSSLTKWI
jgi:hypothetical protein